MCDLLPVRIQDGAAGCRCLHLQVHPDPLPVHERLSRFHDQVDRMGVFLEICEGAALPGTHDHSLVIRHPRRAEDGRIDFAILRCGAQRSRPQRFVEVVHQLFGMISFRLRGWSVLP